MKILVAGSSGFIGNALVAFLKEQGHEVSCLIRKPDASKRQTILWNPDKGLLAAKDLEGFDAWINLCGDSIASGRWTKKKKEAILNSRVMTTRLLADTLTKVSHPPKVWINASAIGFYGETGENIAREGSPAGKGFLAEVTQAWEAEAKAPPNSQTRIIPLRFGVVIGKEGGALKQMLPIFKLGLGGVIGSGKQYMSWIAIQDLTAIILFLINSELHGPVNAVVPRAITNYEFTKTLGKVLRRPTVCPVPAFVARLVFGESAEALLLASTRVEPRRLIDAGYSFRFPTLEQALYLSQNGAQSSLLS